MSISDTIHRYIEAILWCVSLGTLDLHIEDSTKFNKILDRASLRIRKSTLESREYMCREELLLECLWAVVDRDCANTGKLLRMMRDEHNKLHYPRWQKKEMLRYKDCEECDGTGGVPECDGHDDGSVCRERSSNLGCWCGDCLGTGCLPHVHGQPSSWENVPGHGISC